MKDNFTFLKPKTMLKFLVLISLFLMIPSSVRADGIIDRLDALEVKLENLSAENDELVAKVDTLENQLQSRSRELTLLRQRLRDGLMLAANTGCPTGMTQRGQVAIQVRTPNGSSAPIAGTSILKSVTGNTSWDVSVNYDGRVFRICKIN